MTLEQLRFARKDLQEVIETQEAGNRRLPGTFPVARIGQYYDDLSDVNAEINRRERSRGCPACGK